MTDRPRPSKRAAREATEAAMLASATGMLLESPAPDVLGALRPVEVARRCDPPRTTGAFYNIWSTQGDFRQALLDHLLSEERFAADGPTMDLLDTVLAATAPAPDLDETVRVAANLNFDGMKGDPAVRLQHALWTQAAGDPDTARRLRTLYTAFGDTLVPRLALLLDRTGRRMAAPFTVQLLAVALTALVEGLNLRWAVDPAAVPDDAGPPPGVRAPGTGRWSTFAATAHVLFTGMTEPVDGEGP